MALANPTLPWAVELSASVGDAVSLDVTSAQHPRLDDALLPVTGTTTADVMNLLIDGGADFAGDNVEPGDVVRNVPDGTEACVQYVSTTTLYLYDDIFDAGEAYAILLPYRVRVTIARIDQSGNEVPVVSQSCLGGSLSIALAGFAY